MAEFVISDRHYRSHQIPVRKQFHVLRRMGSLYPSIVVAETLKASDPVLAISSVAQALSHLSDTDTDFVLDACLAVTVVKQAENLWVPIVNASGDFQFKELGITDLLQICRAVLEENFGPFIRGLVQQAPAPGTTAKP